MPTSSLRERVHRQHASTAFPSPYKFQRPRRLSLLPRASETAIAHTEITANGPQLRIAKDGDCCQCSLRIAGAHHDAQFDDYAGGWSLISVVTPSSRACLRRPDRLDGLTCGPTLL
jgi:hypothetical protein